MADGMLSPAGAVSGTLQEILTRKKLDARQAMLDKMAQDAADLNKRNVESEMTARQGASQLAFENLGQNAVKLQQERDAQAAEAAYRQGQNQIGMENLGLQVAAQADQRNRYRDRPLTVVSPSGKPTIHENVQIPGGQVLELNHPPTSGSGTGASLKIPNNYRVELPGGKTYEAALTADDVTSLMANNPGAKVLRLSPDQVGLMDKASNQTMAAVRQSIQDWSLAKNTAQSGLGNRLTRAVGVQPSETPEERTARTNAQVAFGQLTSGAPADLLSVANQILADPDEANKNIQQIVTEGNLSAEEYTPDELQTLNELLTIMRDYYSLAGNKVIPNQQAK